MQRDVPLRNWHPVMQRDKLSIGTEHVHCLYKNDCNNKKLFLCVSDFGPLQGSGY